MYHLSNLCDVITTKYRSVAKPIKASFWFVVSSIILRGISFVTLPLFTRLLSTDEYGIVSVYSSWANLISIIATLTLWGGVLNVGITRFSERKDELLSTFQGLAISITLFFFLISMINIDLAEKLTGLPTILIFFIFIDILASIPINIWSTGQRYIYAYKLLISISFLTAILNPILGYIAIIGFPHNKVEAKVISGVIVNLLIGIILFIFCQKKGKKFYDKELWFYALKLSIILIPYYLSMQVLNQSDRIMIKSICGDSDAGIYSVAYSFAMLLGLVTNGILASLAPYIYSRLKSKKLHNIQNRMTGVVLSVSFVTMLIICAVPDVFTFMLPKTYYKALYVIPPVTLGSFFMFIYPLFSTIEMYYEENAYITIASSVAAVTNIVLNYIFIKIYGFMAAAYTTLFCYIVQAIAHYFFMVKIQKKHGDNIKVYNIPSIIIICGLTIVLGMLMLCIYDYLFIRWMFMLSLVVCACFKRKWIKDNLISIFRG